MAHISDFLTGEDIGRVSRLQVLARQVVEGFTTGLHRSPHKGFSVEFKQHRQYVPGDDLRHVDWKVFGKSDRFYIREYEEETNLRCTILLDASASMAYGGSRTPDGSKFRYAQRVAAALTYLMLQQADSVGLVTFDTEIRKYIPPRSRPAHLRVLIDELAATKPGGETELGRVFHDLVPMINRRGLVVVLSDCFGDVTSLMKALAHLRHARHEVILMQIWDPDELDFPFRQWTRFDSLEDTSDRQMVDPSHLRAAYMDNLAKFRAELKDGCGRHRIDLAPMTTDQPYADALAAYLASRLRAKR
ncbi:DUF58 domain-containing protein [Planctomycetales bacterium ZRK34]|nr:DUF58 domain-containing protein [Planctomycetales bacterium ZRK34]